MGSVSKLIYGFLWLSLPASALFAQEPTFRSQSNVVLVPALVRNALGHAVYGLQAKDFILEDNGVAQIVSVEDAAESEPLSLIVAIQTGRSARHELPRIHGLGAMLSPILAEPQAQVAIVEFDSQIQMAQDFTSDADQIERALQGIDSGDDGAAILDTVKYCVGLLNKLPQNQQRVLLLISESRDHGSRWANIDDIVTLIGASNTTLFSLTFSPALSNVLDTERGSNKEDMSNQPDLIAPLALARQAIRKNAPKAIAAQTGGEYRLFESRAGFETRITDFTNHLHSRYVLSFQPRSPTPGLHRLSVRLAQPGNMTVLARGSYWAASGTQ